MREENILEEMPVGMSELEGPTAAPIETSPIIENPMMEKEINLHFEEFKQSLDQLPDAEAKLKLAISFMEDALQKVKTPDFKNFWDARKVCLDLFKEPMSPAARSHLWGKYHELSKEAKRLKDILDEQSNFAVEQIGMAIQALEEEIAQIPTTMEQSGSIDFPENCFVLEKSFAFYDTHQKELNLLNAYASRINALRKELIKTEMRIRVKNKFFQQLSKAGDHVFPKRKELIQEISQHFINDVESFISSHFNSFNEKESIFNLREAIKGLQSAAKFLTLNTQAFNQTRMRLSECWDKLKEYDKERKKDFADKKELFKANAEAIRQEIEATFQKFSEQGLNTVDANRAIDELVSKMRSTSLGRDEVKSLRDEILKFKDAIQSRIQAQQEERQRLDEEKERQRRETVQRFAENIQQLLDAAEEESADHLVTRRDAILAEIQSTQLLRNDKIELEKRLKPIKDILIEKKEQALMALPEDKRMALEQLKELLRQRKERRQKIKEQLELLRKSKGASGLDFEKAMQFNEELNHEKGRLEQANHSVKEIEDKIKEMEL
ncbi:hypothetical protein PHSC3_001852 [Chlamydiales bacterium STE3]|nr:hypothetical protein PHSC3_001852 [Chlamydiales bacterium STE3]